MANEVRTKSDAAAAFTLSLASLADGSARQSTMIANSTGRPGAIVYLAIKSGGTGPTAGAVYEVYLLRGDSDASPIQNDAAGASDAAITIENAPLLGTIVLTNTANKLFYGVFDTAPLGPLGPVWGIAVKNSSGQALHATEGDHLKHYVYYVPEVQ